MWLRAAEKNIDLLNTEIWFTSSFGYAIEDVDVVEKKKDFHCAVIANFIVSAVIVVSRSGVVFAHTKYYKQTNVVYSIRMKIQM